MRSLHWPGLRQASAVVAAAGCLTLAACGGGGSPAAKPATPKPASSTAAAEPASGAAAVAAITANWKTVFNGKAPIPRRLALVQNGSQLTAFIEATAKTSFGQAAMGSTATVSSVIISSAQATVHWNLLLLGTPLLKNQVGNAVYLDGVWKVSIASFCGLAYLEYPKGSPQLPAACRN
ncbi:MAG TPA: hypothetical protein VGM12_00910 [Trebonia sp.]|jgi:hypothetical protein